MALMTQFIFDFSESSPGDFGYVTSSPRIRQYNNGSLVIWDVEISDKGFYLCQANNGIGAALSKVIFLNVQGKVIS